MTGSSDKESDRDVFEPFTDDESGGSENDADPVAVVENDAGGILTTANAKFVPNFEGGGERTSLLRSLHDEQDSARRDSSLKLLADDLSKRMDAESAKRHARNAGKGALKASYCPCWSLDQLNTNSLVVVCYVFVMFLISLQIKRTEGSLHSKADLCSSEYTKPYCDLDPTSFDEIYENAKVATWIASFLRESFGDQYNAIAGVSMGLLATTIALHIGKMAKTRMQHLIKYGFEAFNLFSKKRGKKHLEFVLPNPFGWAMKHLYFLSGFLTIGIRAERALPGIAFKHINAALNNPGQRCPADGHINPLLSDVMEGSASSSSGVMPDTESCLERTLKAMSAKTYKAVLGQMMSDFFKLLIIGAVLIFVDQLIIKPILRFISRQVPMREISPRSNHPSIEQGEARKRQRSVQVESDDERPVDSDDEDYKDEDGNPYNGGTTHDLDSEEEEEEVLVVDVTGKGEVSTLNLGLDR